MVCYNAHILWAAIGAGVAGAIYAITRGSDNDSGGLVNIEI